MTDLQKKVDAVYLSLLCKVVLDHYDTMTADQLDDIVTGISELKTYFDETLVRLINEKGRVPDRLE